MTKSSYIISSAKQYLERNGVKMSYPLIKPNIDRHHPMWGKCDTYINVYSDEVFFQVQGIHGDVNSALDGAIIPSWAIDSKVFELNIDGTSYDLFAVAESAGHLVFRTGVQNYNDKQHVLFRTDSGWMLRLDGIAAKAHEYTIPSATGGTIRLGVDAYVTDERDLPIYPAEATTLELAPWQGSTTRTITITSSLEFIAGWMYDNSEYVYSGFGSKKYTKFQLGAGRWKFSKYETTEIGSSDGTLSLSGFTKVASTLRWSHPDYPGGYFYCSSLAIQKEQPFVMDWFKEDSSGEDYYPIEWRWVDYTSKSNDFRNIHIADLPAWR